MRRAYHRSGSVIFGSFQAPGFLRKNLALTSRVVVQVLDFTDYKSDELRFYNMIAIVAYRETAEAIHMDGWNSHHTW
jgi:hypothetical protein